MSDTTASIDITAHDLASRVFKTVEENVRGIDRVARVATKAFNLLALGFGVREIGQAAAAYERVQARLKSLSTSSESYNAIQQRLFAFAQRTGTSFETVTENYQKAAAAARESGDSQEAATQKVLRSLELQAAAQSEASAASTRLANSTAVVIGKMSEASGVTSIYTALLNGLSDAMDVASGSASVETLSRRIQQINDLMSQGVGDAGMAVERRKLQEELAKKLPASLDATVREIDANIKVLKLKGRELEDALLDSLEIKLAPHKKREPIDIGIRPGDDQGEAFERSAALATAAFAKAGEESKRIRDQIESSLEQVRQSTLSESQVEAEATQNRLKIVHDALEAKLIDQQKYEQLSTEVRRRGAQAQLQIDHHQAAKERQLSAQRIDNIRGLTDAVASALTAGGENSKREFEQHKKIALAAAVVDTAAAAVLALRSGPPPGNFIAAAAVAAYGLAQVRNIRSTSWSGGGEGGGGGAGAGGGGLSGGGAAPRETPLLPARERGEVRVEISGNHFYGPGGATELAKFVVDTIKHEVNDRDVIFVDHNSAQARVIRGRG